MSLSQISSISPGNLDGILNLLDTHRKNDFVLEDVSHPNIILLVMSKSEMLIKQQELINQLSHQIFDQSDIQDDTGNLISIEPTTSNDKSLSLGSLVDSYLKIGLAQIFSFDHFILSFFQYPLDACDPVSYQIPEYERLFNRPLPHPNPWSIAHAKPFRTGSIIYQGHLLIGVDDVKDAILPYNVPPVNIHKCFNCDRPDHLISSCPYPQNPLLIAKNKSLYQKYQKSQKNQDHHGGFGPISPISNVIEPQFVENHQPSDETLKPLSLQNIQFFPGRLSNKLASALDVYDDNYPEQFVYNIRRYGYPPSYLGPLYPSSFLKLFISKTLKTSFNRQKRPRDDCSVQEFVQLCWPWFVCFYDSLDFRLFFPDSWIKDENFQLPEFESNKHAALFFIRSVICPVVESFRQFENNTQFFRTVPPDTNNNFILSITPKSEPQTVFEMDTLSLSFKCRYPKYFPLLFGNMVQYPGINSPPFKNNSVPRNTIGFYPFDPPFNIDYLKNRRNSFHSSQNRYRSFHQSDFESSSDEELSII